jgi:hypothetical protein
MIDQVYSLRKKERTEESISEYAQKAKCTLGQFKAKHQRSIQGHKNHILQKQRTKQQYIEKIQEVEKTTERNKKHIKRLEEIEKDVIEQLKDTTMMHQYVQSRYEGLFWSGLTNSIISKKSQNLFPLNLSGDDIYDQLGAQSFRESDDLFENESLRIRDKESYVSPNKNGNKCKSLKNSFHKNYR